MTGTINQQETNFRIQALQIDELISGGKCGSGGGRPGNSVTQPFTPYGPY